MKGGHMQLEGNAGGRVANAIGVWALLAVLCVLLTRCPLP